MWKYIFILIALLTTSCSHSTQHQVVQIVGSYEGSVAIRGMGIILGDDTLLTSAHVVPDDRYQYTVDTSTYIVLDRDTVRDRALLGKVNAHKRLSDIHLSNHIQKGDSISTQVYRSGLVVTLTGIVIDPVGSILGYDRVGKVNMLSGIVITDISLELGDSGAPIYNQKGELIDVVHVSREK